MSNLILDSYLPIDYTYFLYPCRPHDHRMLNIEKKIFRWEFFIAELYDVALHLFTFLAQINIMSLYGNQVVYSVDHVRQ